MTSTLPYELWDQVFEYGSWQQRAVCQMALGVVKCRLLFCRRVGIAVMNLAARDGQLPLLKWALSEWDIHFKRSCFHEYPAAFAMEHGQVHILEYLISELINPYHIFCFGESLPAAMERGHWHVVEWLIQQAPSNQSGYIGCFSLDQLKEIYSKREYPTRTGHGRAKPRHLTNF